MALALLTSVLAFCAAGSRLASQESAAAVQWHDQSESAAPASAATRCCCNVSSHGGVDSLSCQQVASTFLLSSCPEGTKFAAHFLDSAGVAACNVSSTLGPPTRACKGATSACVCPRTVDTLAPSNGPVKGRVLTPATSAQKVAGFFGLHYAAYEGRWEHSKPLPSRGWTATDSTSTGPANHCSTQLLQQLRTTSAIHDQFCFQWLPALGRFGSESCLTLDVYTPAVVQVAAGRAAGASPYRLAQDSKLPVMIFIEGGGFLMGDKYQQGIYDARKLARRQNIIVVTVNYRLGVFGFLHHPHLRDEAGALVANFGLRDQLQAMRWVQANIAAFGGDPGRVTLVAESAGAMSVCAHLASPTSRRYFSGAVLESGNCDGLFIWQPQKYAVDFGARYLRAVFGRIRGCHFSPTNQTYQDSQNGCRAEDTPPVKEVANLCKDLFFARQELALVSPRAFVEMLPFEDTGGCDSDYQGCTAKLPSGLDLDKALLQCALRLPTKYVWVNQFGLLHHVFRPDSSYVERFMSMAFWGVSPPARLPWAPVVDPTFRGELDLAEGSGLIPLPEHTYDSWAGKVEMRSITAGFNRDEGSLFYMLLPLFLKGIKDTSRVSDSDYRQMIKALACPDFGVACVRPGCVEQAECGDRVEKLVKAYDWEPSSLQMRGKCCSSDPNVLRLQRMMTDHLFVCPTLRFLGKMHELSTATIRSYTFAADDEMPAWLPPLRDKLGAFHFSELFFIMGDQDGPGGDLPVQGGALGFGLGWSKQDRVISANMSGSWGGLVRQEDLPYWPTWDSGQLIRFALDVPNNVDVMPIGSIRATHHCKIFDELNAQIIEDVH